MPSLLESPRAAYRVHLIRPDDLPVAAATLGELRGLVRADGVERRADPPGGPEAVLRWRLLGNPDRRDDLPLGYAAVDGDGRFRGVHFQHPTRFRLGDATLVGYCSSDFYVHPDARMQGFYLFRRFLHAPGVDFCYATTCNANSARLWSVQRVPPAVDSDVECVVPLRLEPFVRRGLCRRRAGGALTGLGARAARALDATRRLAARSRNRLNLAPCSDWDWLAAVAERFRAPQRLAPLRTAAYLRWKLGEKPTQTAVDVLRLAGPGAAEGWVALSATQDADGVRQRHLIDWSWDPQRLGAHDALCALVQHYGRRADELILRGGAADWPALPWRRRRRKQHHNAFMTGVHADGRPLAQHYRFKPADGDTYPS